MMACVAAPIYFDDKMVEAYTDIDAQDIKVKFT
jgi:hypothetical protein